MMMEPMAEVEVMPHQAEGELAAGRILLVARRGQVTITMVAVGRLPATLAVEAAVEAQGATTRAAGTTLRNP